MGVVAPVDVPGGDLGSGHIVLGDRQRASVIRPSDYPVERPGQRTIQLQDLAPAGPRIIRIGRCLAIHPDELSRQLHHPVGLRGHDIGVLGQAHVETLAAASQGEEEPVGRVTGRRPDGH